MNFKELTEIEGRLLRPVQLESDSLLWHYTDTQGLEGIVAKREFRLGHPGFLNDPSELQYANNIYDDMLSRLSGDPDISVQEFVSGYRDSEVDFRRRYGKTMNPTPFVASFCEDRDNLDLWRQYGDDGRFRPWF